MCLCSSLTPKLFESPNVRQIFTTEGGVTASKCTTTYLPKKFQKCGGMAIANNTEAEDVVACYKVTCSAVFLLVVQVTQVSVAADFRGCFT